MRDDWYRWIGAILIMLGIFFDMICILGATVISEEMEASPEQYIGVLGFCSAVFLIPGIILFAWGWKLGKEEQELEKLAGYLKSYRRITISDISRKLGKTEYESEQLITKCVDKGLIRGYFDRSSGEFFTYESLFEEVERPDKCPNCGASMYTRLLSGESAVCNYCGTTFTPPPLPRPPPQTPPYQAAQPYPQPPSYYQMPPQPYGQQPYQQMPQPQPQAIPNIISVRCPNCQRIFDVQQQTGPFRITCKYCGTTGMMQR